MSENSYEKVITFFQHHAFLRQLVITIGKAITVSIYVFYPLFLLYLYFISYSGILKVILLPLISFIILSGIRKILNFPRPYEKYDIKPLYKKSKIGCSFPSRHTFSAFIIAFVVFPINIPLGIILTALAVILAVTRVLCGIHFIRDVIAGMLFAAVSSICGMFL